MPLSDSPSSASADASSEGAPAWFRMEMDKGITKIQETLSERISKIDVLVDKLHEDQKVTKGRVTKSEDHADQQAAILEVHEDVYQKHKKLEDSVLTQRIHLNLTGMSKALEFPEGKRAHRERAHRTLWRNAPRAFVIKSLQYRDTVRILAAARAKGELKYGDARIFPALSPIQHEEDGFLPFRGFCGSLACRLCGSKPRMVSTLIL